MVLAGAVSLGAWALMVAFSYVRSWAAAWGLALPMWVAIGWIAAQSPPATALLVAGVMAAAVGIPLVRRNAPAAWLWDRSMLQTPGGRSGFQSLWFWWTLFAAALGFLYFLF